jgi:hypothetical protein
MNIKEIWNKSWQALEGVPGGFALKKVVTALFCVCAVVLVFMYTNNANFLAVLGQLLTFILAVLAVRKMEKKDVLNAAPKEEAK